MQRAYRKICNVGAAAPTGCPKPDFREASRPTVAAIASSTSLWNATAATNPESIKRQAIAMHIERAKGYSKTDGMMALSLAPAWLKLGWI